MIANGCHQSEKKRGKKALLIDVMDLAEKYKIRRFMDETGDSTGEAEEERRCAGLLFQERVNGTLTEWANEM